MDRPASERERRARPPSAPHGDGPAWRGPGRAGHVPLPSPSESCSEPTAAGAAGPAGPRARNTVETAGRRSGEPDPGPWAREAERRVAARAPGRRSPAAAPRARGERTGSGPTGPGCVAARSGPRAGARLPGGGAARSWSVAETGRPAGRPEKAGLARRTGPARVSAEGPAKQQGGAGVLARHVANRAESKACKSEQGS